MIPFSTGGAAVGFIFSSAIWAINPPKAVNKAIRSNEYFSLEFKMTFVACSILFCGITGGLLSSQSLNFTNG